MKHLTPPPPPTTENPSEEGSNTGAGGLCDLCNQLEQSNAQLEECKRTKADCEKKLEQCLKDKEGLQSSQGTGGSGLPEFEFLFLGWAWLVRNENMLTAL
jgi:hypothetical protein